ncbi:MAG: transcription termination factor NusA [Caldilineaceae bacterium]
MSKALIAGITQVASDKGLDKEVIFDAIEAALVSAYKRNYGAVSNVSAEVDRTTGDMRVFAEREVVEDVMNERTEIALDDARKQEPKVELGDVIRVEMPAEEFGRIAAQTAKQVILQRIREAERDTVYENFAHKVGEILTAQVRSIDATSGAVTLLLDEKHEILMMKEDQIGPEKLRRGDFLKVYVVDVHKSTRGPVIKLSRTHRTLLRRLMEQEIPEVRDGLVEIKAIAREPGARSKAAVIATVPNVDPVGSCVGQRGLRIQNIVNELAGEKIDVIEWHAENAQYISNALSPARVTSVLLDEKSNIKTAIVIVPDKQLSLAIGKEGQNARLAAKLTGWRIDIKSESEAAAEGLDRLVVERAAARMASKQEDLLAVAERLLKGDDAPVDDRLWAAAARALESAGPAGPEIAEQMMGADDGAKARKPKTKARGEDDTVDELAEGLPEDVTTSFATLGPVGALPSAELEDAFARSLQAVESTPETSLPSEAPFSEKELPATPAEDVLPTVITGDMLRARMAQRKEAELRNIEIPKELLAGLENIDPAELERPVAKPKKPAPAAAKPAAKPKKKKWYPVDGGDEETVY